MKREKQFLFDRLNLRNAIAFGGALLKNSHAKDQRPISTKRTMHMVLRSSLCKGALSFLEYKNSRMIQKILKNQSKIHGVKIYKIGQAYNHIHLLLLPKTREGFIAFSRAVTGLIPRSLLGAQKGKAKGKKFWDKRPWTRIISWGREFGGIVKYLEQNNLEAFGFIPYQPRTTRFNTA